MSWTQTLVFFSVFWFFIGATLQRRAMEWQRRHKRPHKREERWDERHYW